MSWKIEYHKEADKFLNKNPQHSETLKDALRSFVRYLEGETTPIDIKKLHAQWDGYYRIRRGDIRIILSFDREEQNMYIRKIDFRGSVY